jgi:taurine transport system ATP-binding protein
VKEGRVATTELQSGDAAATRPGALRFADVHHVFGHGVSANPVLGPIDLAVRGGEFLCIVGASGCGKSTLLRLIAGFTPPSHGSISIDGREIMAPGPDRGMVFQQPTLFPWRSVRGNVELALKLRGLPRDQRRAEAERLLRQVGLGEAMDRRTYELSGGMQQRCATARALAGDPAVLLMDEPFGALDAITREHMQQELHALWSATGKTIVFVTHSVDEALVLGTRVIVLGGRPGHVLIDLPLDLRRDAAGDTHHDAMYADLRSQIGHTMDDDYRRSVREAT